LAGAGRRAADVYAPALSACPDVDLVAVWGRSAPRVHQLAERHGAAPCERFEDLADRCAAIVFAVPPAVQQEYAARAARHGRGLLLEKPIGEDVAGAEELTSVAVREQVPTMVALPWRFTPGVRRFLSTDVPAIDPVGGIGRLYTRTQARGAATPAWRLARGVLREQAADLLDLLEAALGTVVGLHAHGHQQGWVGMMLDHQVGRFSEASLYAGLTEGGDRAEVELVGRRGTAQVDAGTIDPGPYEQMIAEFARAVTEGRPHRLDVGHGLHLQRLIGSAQSDLLLHG
jgi:predicted dehydrogenase